MSVALFTNNPNLLALFPGHSNPVPARPGSQLLSQVNAGQQAGEKFIPMLFRADASAVITAARDLIHAEWRLLHHPMYGNYRPNQQPYRSILLESPAACAAKAHTSGVDALSLHLIEEALLIYENCPALPLEKAPLSLKKACAQLDCELLLLPLEQCGALHHIRSLNPMWEQG